KRNTAISTTKINHKTITIAICLTIIILSTLFSNIFTSNIRQLPTPTLFPTRRSSDLAGGRGRLLFRSHADQRSGLADAQGAGTRDRKSTRLNSSHLVISYAVFCLKKKKNNYIFRLVNHENCNVTI